MRQSARVIIFNADEDYSALLRADLLSVDGVQIVAEVDELALIEQAVNQFQAEVLVIHLDPFPEVALPVAAQIAQTHPGIHVLVVSDSTDAQHILTAMRAGVREFLSKPVDRQLLATAIARIMVDTESSVQVGKLISVVGTIGGVGASVLATNLAVELVDFAQERPVAVVDLDFRYGQLGTMLDLGPDYTIADLCDTPEKLDPSMIERAMVKHKSGVHLLGRPYQFAQSDQITAAHCASVLSSLQEMYEYVIVDGPNRFDAAGASVIDLADATLIVIQLLVTSARNVHRMLEELKHAGYNLDRFQIICNRVGLDSAHLAVEHIEQTLGCKVAHQIPDDWKAVSGAVNMGVPLKEAGPRSSARAAIRQLAERLAFPQRIEAAASSAKAGIFGRIFSGAS